MYPTTTRNLPASPFRSLLEDFFGESAMNDMFGEGAATRRFLPAMDLREDNDAYFATVELPGLRKEDVKISLHEQVLTIQGEKKSNHEEQKEGLLRMERSYGGFQRRLRLPLAVDAEHIHAEMKEGVLELRLPKVQKAEARQITIN
jgi:HSP20 family protein